MLDYFLQYYEQYQLIINEGMAFKKTKQTP